ncbi:hypothetical protein JM81_0281 [Maribacter sp. MAR_2009_72]|nr:hypothetical protein JM81_0281 [Maribacter sp. MAR_2009_72]
MQEEPLIFKHKEFPIIKVFDKHFEIKAIDYWEYRTFKYSEIKEISHFNPNDKWWSQLYLLASPINLLFSKNDQWVLNITKINGGDWTYNTSNKYNSNFRKIIDLLKKKIVDTQSKN